MQQNLAGYPEIGPRDNQLLNCPTRTSLVGSGLNRFAGLAFSAYESLAEGRLESVDGKFPFTAITIQPLITPKAGADAAKAMELIEKAAVNCLISDLIEPRSSSRHNRWTSPPKNRVRPVVP